jgi:curved DNA-binding protein
LDYKDYYKALGVARDADEKTIRKEYRKLARQYHPDVNPGDKASEERFKEITEAYEVLSDPAKREKYDRFGAAWQQHERAGQAGGFDWSAWSQGGTSRAGPQVTYASAEDLESLFGRGGFSSFFETLFGGSPRGPTRAAGSGQRAVQTRKGQDVEYPVTVSLAEVHSGTTRVLSKDGRRLEVKIPPGVRTGSRVRLAGEGAPGAGGGPPGDLYFVIEVAPDPRFTRQEDDLSTTTDIPLATAMLGGEVPVNTLGGPVKMSIPAETPQGRRFRLKGKGLPKLKEPDLRGDLYVTANVVLPTALTDEERALFERLRALREEAPAQA